MLVANQQTIELGSLQISQPHKFSYILKNTSDSKTVKIKKLTVGCGSCTQASTTKTEVSPGESAKIEVVFTPNSTGLQSKTITVWTDGGEIALSFKAKV